MQTLELTKQDALIHWAKHVQIFNTVHVRQWGLDNFYIRADRTMREFAEQGMVRRLPDEEAILRGFRKKGQAPIALYEFVSM
jgi:hypothetical protein